MELTWLYCSPKYRYLLGFQLFQKQMHSIRKDVFFQQTENIFLSAYVDYAMHADLHLLASLHHLEQTQINYLHTMPPTKTTSTSDTHL